MNASTGMGPTTGEGLAALYREVVLDHHRDPRGRHELARVDAAATGHNPTCGDEVQVQLQLAGERVEDLGIRCRGCAISVATGSMLAELGHGRSVGEVRRLAHALQRLLRGEPLDGAVELGDLAALAGVRQFPARIPCAALACTTLLAAIDGALALTPQPGDAHEAHR